MPTHGIASVLSPLALTLLPAGSSGPGQAVHPARPRHESGRRRIPPQASIAASNGAGGAWYIFPTATSRSGGDGRSSRRTARWWRPTTRRAARGPALAWSWPVHADGSGVTRVFAPLPDDILAEEQHQYYLYSLLRLVPLKEKGVKLHAVFPDSAGHAGIRVERAGRLPVMMYFDSAGTGGADGDPSSRCLGRWRVTLQVLSFGGSTHVEWRALVQANGDPARGQAVLRPGRGFAGNEAIDRGPAARGPALTTPTPESRRATWPPRYRATPAAGRRPHRW